MKRQSNFATHLVVAILAIAFWTLSSSMSYSDGAIVVGNNSYEDAVWGVAINWDTARDAEGYATIRCKERGSNCEIQISFRHTCAALAFVEDRKSYPRAYTARGSTLHDAKYYAQDHCERAEGWECFVAVSICDRADDNYSMFNSPTRTRRASSNSFGGSRSRATLRASPRPVSRPPWFVPFVPPR